MLPATPAAGGAFLLAGHAMSRRPPGNLPLPTMTAASTCAAHPVAAAAFRCDGCERRLCEACVEHGHRQRAYLG